MNGTEIDVLEKFVSERTGIVKRLHVRRKDILYIVNSETPDYEHLPGVEDSFNFWAGATETSLETAKKKAIAEALERYSMLMPQQTESKTVEEAIRNSALELEDICWFSSRQSVRYETPDEEDKLEFIEGINIEGERVLFPARLLINNYRGKDMETADIGYPTTSGCATGFEYTNTIRRGIMEQIERHNVLSAWFSEDTLTEISLTDKEEEFAEKVLGSKVSDYHLIDATGTLGVPTFLGVCYSRESSIGPAWSFSSALSRDKAVEDALLELAQSWNGAVKSDRSTGYPGNRFEKTDGFLSRVGQKKEFSGEDREFARLIDRIKSEDLSVYFFDISASELSLEGLNVTRTIIPEFIQFGSFYAMFLGNQEFKKRFNVDKCLENRPAFLH